MAVTKRLVRRRRCYCAERFLESERQDISDFLCFSKHVLRSKNFHLVPQVIACLEWVGQIVEREAAL